MQYCFSREIKDDNGTSWFVIFTSIDVSVIKEPTKYLKHKTNEHCSPNTVQRIAYAMTYYYSFLAEKGLSIEQILQMKYSAQHEHFVSFLHWVREGNHCDRNNLPNNSTCNAYLRSVFGFYEFVILESELYSDLKVLESRNISYRNTLGIQFRRSINTFRGYLPEVNSKGATIEKDKIQILLEASDSIRNKLLILFAAETGFRIGEILGIRYATDIDYEAHLIYVWFRENNENDSRAKDAEERHAKISDDTFDLLMIYISENRHLLEKTGYLFINLFGCDRGKPLEVNAVYSAFNLLEKKTGIKVTPHMLRHYFANERRKAGWPIEKTSKALGHKHISTTENYMDISDEEMSEAMEKYYSNNKGLYDIRKFI